MASTKNDAEAPKGGAAKKWDGNAERDLCVAMLMGNSPDGEKIRASWAAVHGIMNSLGYDFTKRIHDAMDSGPGGANLLAVRAITHEHGNTKIPLGIAHTLYEVIRIKTILKDFKARQGTGGAVLPASPKKTPTKRKKAATEAAAAEVEAEADPVSTPVKETAGASTPPATPTSTKGRKRAPAKPKATGPPKPRGRKPKSAATVKLEEEEEEEKDGREHEPAPSKTAGQKAQSGDGPGVKTEDAREAEEEQSSPAKKFKAAEPKDEDTTMTDDT
ncbi:hypothetical protein IF2G_03629 [Cordyceps javanica]|nr:hypothetical protein IF2G_03629 [Cordyceps javanica]